ncbi:NAD(P)/FAD-dependent oxidoreductase [Aquimarina sp. D1M17]|uniref:NAD(P)/FAD-dependent oxidoreductase n=1 Tax=Aquimarina acroporae TaxID=2937283 RepID=UPI0020C07B98|nr:NAD(P)/FAD-dependent oxidoreductase [Aquimarina acroporae]MCK8520051.1 NAD(P)/FAD-dependent oxidoreductase [Aquimarina acroporae]
MNNHSHILVIGGGLAGLCSAIHLAKSGIEVTLIEKDTYPRHKVCGEYISNEVLPYFEYLGIQIDQLQAVNISKLNISTQKGDVIQASLPLGGFGISRYTLDYHLWQMADRLGVNLINDQVTSVSYSQEKFVIGTSNTQTFICDYVIGAHGKRSSIDKTLHRAADKSPWLAVKMHYEAKFNSQEVALHNFEGGYCGLSVVENNLVNACYLVHYDSFKRFRNLESFQNEVLFGNPHLKAFFQSAIPAFDKPLTISQVNFQKKKAIDQHVFMVGDAAGLIHPLCGNGMAMAIQSAQILSQLLIKNYKGKTGFSRSVLEQQYEKEWKKAFGKRLYAGRVLQKVLLNHDMQRASYQLAKLIPSIVPKIIKQTHGELLVC